LHACEPPQAFWQEETLYEGRQHQARKVWGVNDNETPVPSPRPHSS
jgi:hypothetical protein